MNKLDYYYLKCLGYDVNFISDYCMTVKTEKYAISIRDNEQETVIVYAIRVTDNVEKNQKELDLIKECINESSNEIEKLKQVLSVPEKKKRKVIADNLENLL